MTMKIKKGLLTLLIPLILIVVNASILTTSPYLHVSKGLYATHDSIEYDHDYAIDRIMGYLNYRYDNLYFGATEDDDTILMRDIEIRHMKDVKDVYTFLRIFALGSLVIVGGILYTMIRKKETYQLAEVFKKIWVYPMFFVVFVGGYILIDFNTAFTVFHQIFFSNDDWILYANDVLILLLPTAFWMVSGIIILVLFVIELFALKWVGSKLIK